ncbi:MAG: F0F1 ATP synthase subunit epsilon [Spirochaetaceae bacterium]|jgi:F-type H+-transporting ATPase subunit epsilon|nr:F0F1 ATP synthase subunit epsilon [Spirochaetaceae bacterium]
MKTFALEIDTPSEPFFNGPVEAVQLTIADGEVGVWANHEAFTAPVCRGPLKILKDGTWKEASLSEGLIEVKADKTVILCNTAKWQE